jgi:hypothetical protein
MRAGLYEESDDEEEADERFEKTAHAGSYIAYHARKQLAFDLWWLVLGLWLICIIERDGIADPTTAVWFNQLCVALPLFGRARYPDYATVPSSSKLPRRTAPSVSALASRTRRPPSAEPSGRCRSVRRSLLFTVHS